MNKPDEFHENDGNNGDVTLIAMPAGWKEGRQQQIDHRTPEHGSAIFYHHER